MSNSFLSVENRDRMQIMSNMIRFNNAIHIHDENVAEHSFYVATYSMMICDELKIDGYVKLVCIQKALVHDIHEIEISDIPHNVKKNIEGLEKYCDEYEEEFNKKYFPNIYRLMNTQMTEDERSMINLIVLLADILSVKQYCSQELLFGNTKRFKEIERGADSRINACLLKLEKYIGYEEMLNLKKIIFGKENEDA